jgi:exonuclease SbcC
MRPLRLDVEGFTCYRERQQPLDFSSLSLFAIAGPTGAGKSSILDTMLYALYGEVPRIGKHGIGEFISHGRDTMSVCLDFRISGNDYRVTRRVKRVTNGNLKTTVTLAEVVGGVEKSLADGVKPVNETVVGLLGLGYEEFIQTVVLPQGDFAKFLKATPTEQRSILQHLLRHDVFTRMRDEAEERRKSLSGRVDVIDGKLTTYAAATPEAVAEREVLLVGVRGQVERSTAAREAAETAAQEARAHHALTQEVAKLREQQQSLMQQAPSMECARRELEMARRAEPIVPRLESCGAASAQATRQRQARDQAVQAVEKAARERSQAEARAVQARAAAAECEVLALKVRALDEIAGQIGRRGELSSALANLPPRLAVAETAAKAARRNETAARQAVEKVHASLKALTAALDGVAFDEPLYVQVEMAFAQVGVARALMHEVAVLHADADHATRASSLAEVEEQRVRAAQAEADARAEEAEHQALAAQASLDEGRVRHMAAALRIHLDAGDDCPVCLQAVAELPKADGPPELEALQKVARLAEKRAKDAERARHEGAKALAIATERRASAATTMSATISRWQSRAARLAEMETKLAAAVSSAPADAAGAALLDWIEQRRVQLHAVKEQRERHAQALQRSENEAAAGRLALLRSEAEAAAAARLHEQLVAEQARLQTDLDAVIASIEAVTSHPDPRAERDLLAARVADLQNAERGASMALTQAEARMSTANAARGSADASVIDAERTSATALEALTKALGEAGFVSADEMKAAIRTLSRQAALDAQVTRFDQQHAGITDRLAELDPVVARHEVSAEALADAECLRQAAIEAWQSASQQVTILEHEVAHLQKDLKARTALLAERLALHATLAVTAEMATDLKGDRFQEYLLEEAFKGLVTGASVRMRAISNRYTLEWADSEFHVVDHDNAGERRRADTLSGGETFMASLCLALQLSETVLQASGALQMDSLFIDEGFGTLDTDSLSEVTDAIEALGQNGGRLIGVISHRAELTDRLPGLIRIEKGAGESRWVMERAG